MNVRLLVKIIFGIIFSISQSMGQSRCLSVASVVQERNTRDLPTDTLLTIPIVFHNLYRTDLQVVTDSQVLRQLEILNNDFQRSNHDSINTPSIFRDVAANCRIEFCLAVKDPKGNPNSGVHRTKTDRFEIGLTEDYYRTFQGGQTSWDPSRYLNVWICEISEGGSIAGFAIPPTSVFSEKEGIVIDYRFFGVGGTSVAPFNGGRTLTHEMGHWLGLNHIWGDTASCSADDGISDTPLQFINYSDCPDHPQISCGSEDMFMNFMDLTNDACMSLFTNSQKEVMRSNVNTIRPALLLSDACKIVLSAKHSERLKPLDLFPNPAMDRLHLVPKNQIFQLRLFNTAGMLIFEKKVANSLEIEHLKPGFYLVIATDSTEVWKGSFIKF